MLEKLLKNKKGETITETLVSSIIAAMSMIIFASMAIAANNIITETKDVIEGYYNDLSNINKRDESFKKDDVTLKLYDRNNDNELFLYNTKDYSTPLFSNTSDSDNTKMVIYSY